MTKKKKTDKKEEQEEKKKCQFGILRLKIEVNQSNTMLLSILYIGSIRVYFE